MKTFTLKLSCGLALLALVLPASAFAQATRTWVSGVGDDVNPCSRTAPCKTFAGAISKTAAKGEINCLDPAAYGAVTITKAIAIKCAYTEAGVLATLGSNGVIVNAAATDSVVLEGLDINGATTGAFGIRILQAKSVKIIKTQVFGFVRSAITMEASNSGARLLVADSILIDNAGDGVLVAPPSGGNATATVVNNLIVGNACGLAASNHLPDPAANFTNFCGTQSAGVGGAAKINAFGNTISDHAGTNGTGVFSNGQSSNVRIGDNEITGNNVGLSAVDTGAFGGILSFQDNYLAGNVSDGVPTSTTTKK